MDGGPWRDLGRPPLREPALRRALLPPSGPFARLDVVRRVGSTNAELAAAAAADPAAWPDLSVLTAEHQVAGRGRQSRTWQAPPRAGLAVSVLLRPAAPPSSWSWLPLLAGTAVVEALLRIAGVPAGLKWPNDVLVTDPDGAARKVCGVLTEVLPPEPPAAVVGIGLNVSQARDELPVTTASSLRLAGAATTDRDTVLRAILRSLAATYATWSRAGGDVRSTALDARVRQCCWSLGRAVRVELPGGQLLDGIAEELDEDGRLVVRDGDGRWVPVAAGDVVHAGLGEGG